jgi:hypothetical protein
LAERSLRPSPNVAAVVALVVLAAALLAWQQPWQGDRSTDDGVVALPRDVPTQLTAQLRELSQARSEDAFVKAAGGLPAGRSFGRRTWQSLEAVAMPGATFRYVSGGEVADRADGSAVAVAEVSWRPSPGSGLDPAATHRSSVELRIAPERDGTLSVVGAGASSDALPVWLAGKVTVDVAKGRSVVRIDGGDPDVPVESMTATARTAVERLLPGADGRLTVVSPRTQAQTAAILGQPKDAVAQIAAVTAGIDGDASTRDAVVVLNPVVFATMDRRAAQVVLSHEATHALSAAVGTKAANWVVEGFADFVALRDDTAPLSVSAGQILAEVRAGRTPERLPVDTDFGSTSHGLGAVYESAWMIFRRLAQDHSDADIVAFYRQVVGGEPVDRALPASLDITVEQLTAEWRAYLTKSASTVS